jgi:Concanavalin A-like lectin/glucanases superfamily
VLDELGDQVLGVVSIESEILLKNPVLYWPLDDPTGPAAVDASGNGHHGVYGGSFILGSFGANAGETAAQFGIGGFVRINSFPQLGSAPFTVMFWMSVNCTATGATQMLLQHGAPTGTRGWAFNMAISGQNTLSAYRADGTLMTGASGGSQTLAKQWHPWAITYPGASPIQIWYDGTAGATLALVGGLATITGAEYFQVIAGSPLIAAHVAYWDRVLTSTEILAISAYRQEWPYAPPINATWPEPPAGGSTMLSPSDPIVIQQGQDLTDIRRAVRGEFG